MRICRYIVLVLLLAASSSRLFGQPMVTISTYRGNMVIKATGGISGATNVLLSTTNFIDAFTNWAAMGTNVFDTNGTAGFTNPFISNVARYYAIKQTPLPSTNLDLWIPDCGALFGSIVTNETTNLVSAHEAEIGRQMDVLRIYHTSGSWSALTILEKNYISSGRKLLLSVKPDSIWSNAVGVANGGSATIDSQMTSLAKSIAAIKPAKVMLIVWHEPENDVIGSVASAKAGTTAQYVQMWHNVRVIFDANAATNVIWCWDIENYAPLRYLLPALWPGNDYVDWVMWDQYQSSSGNTYTNVLQEGYNYMLNNSTATVNYLSKPWGLAEWGVGINDYTPTVADQTNGITGLNVALNQYTRFPRIKLVDYFDEGASTLLPGALAFYSNFANSPYLRQQCAP